VRKTARQARADREAVSVKIHTQNGRIQEERTCPRKADPRTTKVLKPGRTRMPRSANP
jgi:hypothetical protein